MKTIEKRNKKRSFRVLQGTDGYYNLLLGNEGTGDISDVGITNWCGCFIMNINYAKLYKMISRNASNYFCIK